MESVHSNRLQEGAVTGVERIYYPDTGIMAIHYIEKIEEPIGLDLGDSDKENVPPEHPYEETPLEREIFGGSESDETDPNHEADWRMGLLPRVQGSGETPDSPIYIPRTPSPREWSPGPEAYETDPPLALYPEGTPGQLTQSFCDSLPDYPEGHFITIHQKRMHDTSNYYRNKHTPYCICRGRADYEG